MHSDSPVQSPAAATSTSRGVFVVVIIAVLLAAVVSTFESTMMYTALPALEADFNSDPSSVSWVLTGFLLVGAASAAISGRLGDVFGRKKVMIILLAASLVGSLISLFAGDILGVTLGRSIQGLAGGLLPLAFGIIRQHVPAKRLSISVGLVAGTAGVAGAAGNIVAGNIVDSWGWRYIFVVAAAMALLTIVVAVLLPRSVINGVRDRIDWIGGILFAPALALILFGINVSSGLGWASPLVLGPIVVGLVILVGWAMYEARVKQPMVNVRLFAQRNLGLTLVAAALLSVPLGVAGFMGQLIMQYPTSAPVGFGLSAGTAGAVSFFCGIFGFAMSLLSGRISRGGRARLSLAIGASVGVVAAIFTVLSAATWHSFPAFVVSQLVLSIATGFQLAALPTLIVEGAPAKNTSESTGVFQVTQNAFTGIGTSVGVAILAAFVVGDSHFASVPGYFALFGLSAVVSAIGFIIALLLRKPKGDPDGSVEAHEVPIEGTQPVVGAVIMNNTEWSKQ